MSAWLKPDSSVPPAMPRTLATEPSVDCATAIRPGTPQLPPAAQSRLPGGLLMALAMMLPMGK
jgi:hypothetical protein